MKDIIKTKGPLARIEAEFNAAFKRFKFWAVLTIILLSSTFAVIVYDFTLPTRSGWLAVPLFICVQLAMIPIWRIRYRLKRCRRDIAAFMQDRRDEYYKAVTGEDRR